jgi:hypothetical protein
MRGFLAALGALLLLGSAGLINNRVPQHRADVPCHSVQSASYAFLSYFGGTEVDDCDDIAVDNAGFIYVVCHSTSNDFPGAERERSRRDMDAYVSKIDPRTGRRVYTTRIGGSAWDGAIRVVVSSTGQAFVAGFTKSADFPMTARAVQPTYGGGDSDAFLVILDAGGNIRHATLVGGSGAEQCDGLAVDRAGTVYLVGATWSEDLPGAGRSRYHGDGDVFITRLHPSRTLSLRSYYLGGGGSEKGTGAILDNRGTLYVAGFTESQDFPVKAAFQAEPGGRSDAFLARLRASDLSIISSTYVGGSGEDAAWG